MAPPQPETEPALRMDASEADALFERVSQEVSSSAPRVPGATYRVQLNRNFTFRNATELLPYLRELGITDLYSSPFFKARPDSMHGYDIVDHNAFAESIGSDKDFHQLCAGLQKHGLGQILDFVPNHMGIGVRDNVWWMDVLENGPSSVFAPFFDIDWYPLKSELTEKVLLPILGDHYGTVLEHGDVGLLFDSGAFSIRCYQTPLPLDPQTYPMVLERLLPGLTEALEPEAEPVLELQSIITGLRHLPLRSELQRPRILERRREKEILKKRLSTLVEQSRAVSAQLEHVLGQLNGTRGSPRSFDGLHDLLEHQAYRISFWRVAAEEVNYRRFFDVNDLAAIRVENAQVFSATHQKLLQLVGEGCLTGLRIDHPDGLWDPTGYFVAVQRACVVERCRRRWLEESTSPEAAEHFWRMRPRLESLYNTAIQGDPRSPLARPVYLVAEKILSRGETLPTEWPTYGTSGYDFTALVGSLLVDAEAEASLTETYESFIQDHVGFFDLVYQKKKLVLRTTLASELNVLAGALNRLSERDRHTRDFTLGSLTDALREVIASFPVYRTYTTEATETVTEHDRIAIGRAIRLARHRNPTTDASVFEFVRAILLLEVPETVAPEDRYRWRDFVMRFQQLTGPVMAKGLEDTAFYIYNRLVSLNEVGGEPERFGLPVLAFHKANALRQREWPFSLLATSTHDTKRSEDVRARISVLSELPEEWRAALKELKPLAWLLKTELDDGRAPDANEEYLFYQTVLGTWPQGPLEGALNDGYVDRIVDYMHKATKEAKVNTSWVDASPEYDSAIEQFVRKALERDSPVRARLEPLAREVAWFGRWSSLSQTLLKLLSPGVPDTYQGNETWDFSLVDPDNRRPVDYRVRREMLKEIRDGRTRGGARFVGDLVSHPEDGRIKLFVTHVALETRRRLADLFGAAGQYVPMEGQGLRAGHVVAFARVLEDAEVVVIAPRLCAKLVNRRPVPPTGPCWEDTTVLVEEGVFRNLLTGEEVVTEEREGLPCLRLEAVLKTFPGAVLERISRSRRRTEQP